MHQIEGSTALVTGGHRGIGKAIVDELLSRGAAKVYATSRSPKSHDDPRVVSLVLDVSDPASVAAAAERATDVSILINNAGVNNTAAVLDGPLDGIRADLETNLFGLVHMTRAFAPILAGQASSSVLNILSTVSFIAFGTGYDLSKSAAWSATNSLRLALAGQGTTVAGLHVGLVDTDMTRDYDMPKADPRDVARQAIDGVEAGDLEVLADESARQAKAGVAGDVEVLYPQFA